MKLKCLLFGCKWDAGTKFWNTGELLTLHYCQRCGSHRVTSQ